MALVSKKIPMVRGLLLVANVRTTTEMASPPSGIAAAIDIISEDLRQCSIAAPIDVISEDLLQNIVSRLPATSFASAACVNRSWNLLCKRLLSRPKLASACSFNHSLLDAVEEVVNKVLSEPIRPHFAIASIAGFHHPDNVVYALEMTLDLITEALGTHVPVIINYYHVVSEEFKETEFNVVVEDAPHRAIMLNVGFLPGLKVATIPLLSQVEEPEYLMIDEFVTDIREFSTSASGCSSPAAIIMFLDGNHLGLRDVMEEMDYAMSPETVVVGGESWDFRCTNYTNGKTAGVALVFAVESIKPLGIGETQFHAVLSSGLSPVGPTYKATSVQKDMFSIWINARREGSRENIDGETILNQVYSELGDRIEKPELYIGVTKKRKCSTGQEKVGCMTFHAFFPANAIEFDEEYFLFDFQEGIYSGDTFRFYHPDPLAAQSSAIAISSHLESLNGGSNSAIGGDKQEVVGGLIFSCGKQQILDLPNIDSSPFLRNFPGVTLGGTFCSTVFGRGVLTPYVEESKERKAVQCCVHDKGAVYLIMSYTPSTRI